MPVYVDQAQHPYRNMLMCHMLADTPDELHSMADLIGMQRRWFQNVPKASCPHYDLGSNKRERAIQNGAIEVLDRQDFVEVIRRVRSIWCPRDSVPTEGVPTTPLAKCVQEELAHLREQACRILTGCTNGIPHPTSKSEHFALVRLHTSWRAALFVRLSCSGATRAEMVQELHNQQRTSPYGRLVLS